MIEEVIEKEKLIIVLYGSTGELVSHKILPAISQLIEKEKVDKQIAVVALGRKNFDAKQYLDYVKEKNKKINISVLEKHVGYVQMDILSYHDYLMLKNILKNISSENTKFVHYFALDNELVLDVCKNLNQSGITQNKEFHNAVFEKPFGKNFKSARKHKKLINKYFDECQIYRIESFLGNNIVRKISCVFLENKKINEFEKAEKLEKITVLYTQKKDVSEKLDVVQNEFQNSVLQMLALCSMKNLIKKRQKNVPEQKVKSIKALKPNLKTLCFGSYLSYNKKRDESKKTQTRTLIFAQFNTKLLKNTQIDVLIGKKMSKAQTKIVFEYSDESKLVFEVEKGVINLVKKFNQNVLYKDDDKILPYENLILDVINSDKTHFVSGAELEASWRLSDKLARAKKDNFIYSKDADIKENIQIKF